MHAAREFTTTCSMPWRLRAQLDDLRLERAAATGRRPSSRDLIVEALELLLRTARTRRRSRSSRRRAQ